MDYVYRVVQIKLFLDQPPPHPTSEDENNNETAVIQVELAGELPKCKGTSVCELCGAGGDCANCPLCQASLQCSPEVCISCIEVFDVPSIDVVDGVVLLADATTDAEGAQVLGELKVSCTDNSLATARDRQASPSQGVEVYSVGTTEYAVDARNQSLTLLVPEGSYTMTWNDSKSQTLAFTYANIISNEQYGDVSGSGCPLASGVRK